MSSKHSETKGGSEEKSKVSFTTQKRSFQTNTIRIAQEIAWLRYSNSTTTFSLSSFSLYIYDHLVHVCSVCLYLVSILGGSSDVPKSISNPTLSLFLLPLDLHPFSIFFFLFQSTSPFILVSCLLNIIASQLPLSF